MTVPHPPLALDWTQIETVFLDMDGTLLDLHYDNHFWLEHLPKCLAAQQGLAEQTAKQQILDHCAEIEGTLNWYSLDYWQERLGLDIVATKHEIAGRIAMRAHVEAFLNYLRQHNKRIVMLTNAHEKTVALKFNYVSLESFFDRIITSHALGAAKEEAAFWECLATQEHFTCENSLFIDDNLQVLRAARDFGIQHLLAISEPDSKQPPKDTAEFSAVHCYTQLMV